MQIKVKLYSALIIAFLSFNFLAANAIAIKANDYSLPDYPEITPYSFSVSSIINIIPNYFYLLLLLSPLIIIFSYFLYYKTIKKHLESQIEPRQLFIKIFKQCLIWSFVSATILFIAGAVYFAIPMTGIISELKERLVEFSILLVFIVILSLLLFASAIELIFFSRTNKDFLKPASYFVLLFVSFFTIIAIVLDYIDYIRSSSFI